MAKKKATTKDTKKSKPRVTVMIPLVEGEEDEVTVGVNERVYKIKKGVPVEVPHEVAVVIKNSNLQALEAKKYRDSVKSVEIF